MSDSPANELHDAVLLDRFLVSRDQVAFALLVHRYHGLVLGVCQRTLSNRHDAEDAFQATFVLLATKGHTIRRRNSVASWLYGAAHRISLRIRRKRKAAQMDAIKEHPMVPGDQHWKAVAEQDCLRHLDAELARLPSSLREPMVLRYLRGLNNESVAAQLGTTVASIEGRLKRAKSQLRMRLLRHGMTLSVAATALLRNQRSARALDVSPLIERTIEQALAASSGSAGTDDVSLATRLAKEEALTMQLIRWSKIAVVGAALIGSVGIPISVRTLVGQGLATGGGGSNTLSVDASSSNGQASSSEERTVRVTTPTSNASSSEGDPFAASAASNPVKPGGDVGTQPSPSSTGQGTRFDIVDSPNVARIEETLLQAGQVEFVDEPLSNAVEFLEQQFGVQIEIDQAAFEDAGVTSDTPLNGSYSNISLRSILNHLLRPKGLDFVIRDEVLQITSGEKAHSLEELRVYRIKPLVAGQVNLAKLSEMIPKLIDPDSWADVGGENVCTTFEGNLVISGDRSIHDQVNELLRKLGYLPAK